MKQYNKKMIILQDVDKKGNDKNWRGKKIGAWHLHRSYQRLEYFSKSARVFSCASYLDYKRDENNEMKFFRSNFCKDPLCPMCASRRSDKLYAQVSRIVSHIDKEETWRYVFLTLTVRNVPGEKLSTQLDEMFLGFNLLTKSKEFKKISKGWTRSLEVTHNWTEDTYHPHIHIAIAVDKEYFSEYKNYLNHDQWMKLWRDCMLLDYDPWVYVKKVRKDREPKEKETISYVGAISEITKYTSKSDNYIVKWKDRDFFEKETGIKLENAKQCEEMTDKAVATLSSALYHRRLISFGGRLRQLHKLLNLAKTKEDNLNTEDEETTGNYVIERYKWQVKIKNYVYDRVIKPYKNEQCKRC